MADDFVHLHVHSEYSLLDGLGRIKNLVEEARRLGQPALALTDHGVMHGAIEFFRACKEQGIRPLIGVEAYQTVYGRPMGGRDSQLDKENYHLLLLAKNMTGYRNLLKIATHAQLDGYYYRPRIDHDFLARHAEGLICTTGCLGAEVPQLLYQGREKEAYDRLGWYVETFGRANFFVELQEHSIGELVQVNKTLVPWADKFGLQMVATNDVHYVRKEDGGPHDVLLCVQTGVTVQTQSRMRMSDGSYFLKSRAQMEATFRPLIDLPPRAFEHTLHIAEMCEVDLEDPNYHLPDIPIPEGCNYESYLRHLTEEGLHRLYGDKADDPVVQERKERELRIIHAMGFDVYFLIVADLCNFARRRNIWWNVRGSGAGSLVAYCTGITGLDPLKNNLIFERFLNPGRVTMPDFDLDFPDDQREAMIRYTVDQFGESQVAQIATFNRMKAKAAVRDVGRAQGIELPLVNRLAKLIPGIPGKPVTIQDCLTEGHEFYSQELVDLYTKEAWVKELLDTAMKLEGVARNAGIHAAAVIVADRELSHYTPLMRGSKSTVTSTIAQYEFPILESIGLLKVDFLGLSTLSVMREAARLIKERHGIEFTLADIPYEGAAADEAFKLITSGEVSGVFQVESAGMRRMLTEMKPTLFEHIVAAISLYRPGPMEYIPQYIRRMHEEERVEFKHPQLETILGETYGICVSGDALVIDTRTGARCRLDQVGEQSEFSIQGVDADWRIASGRVTRWIDSGFKAVVRVTLRNDAALKLTPDHRVLTEEGWRPIGELAPGTKIAVAPELAGQSETNRKLQTTWEAIAAIVPAGVEHVYDLTVEGLHNFVANHIVVHNCVYQEQIIQILSGLAGYTPGEADLVRRAISKKKASDIEKHKKLFTAGCEKNGIDPAIAGEIYADIEFFARYGFNKCLPGDTEVVDAATGRMATLEDLYTGRATLSTTVTCDTATLKLVHGAVATVMDNGVQPVYRLTTALGRTIEATANHPFFAYDGWRRLEELQVGDPIAAPRSLPVSGTATWPDHEVIALGHLLAKGNLRHPHSVSFYSKDPDQCHDYMRAAASFENVKCTAALHKGTFSIYARRAEASSPPGILVWADRLGLLGKPATRKEIPPAAFELTPRQIGLLISRMWEGDGHINAADGALFYATSSERMARQLQHLLLRLGMIGRLRTVSFPDKKGRAGYQLLITGSDNLAAFRQSIGCHFVSAARRAMLDAMQLAHPAASAASDVVPVAAPLSSPRPPLSPPGRAGEQSRRLLAGGSAARQQPYCDLRLPVGERGQAALRRPADDSGHDQLRTYAESEVDWDEIVSIESVGEKQTFDLEIPGTHNFVANDILVHNSHAADYAVITVQTAYLKAHYPVEFMAAQLLVERDKMEKVVNFVSECRRMGVDVLPPDVNYSGLDFEIQLRPPDTPTMANRDPSLGYPFPVPEGSAIRFGMAAIKNVGEGPVLAILDARKEGGPFRSLEEFCDRTDLRQVNKRALECLIKAGALDRFGLRSQLLAVLDQMVAQSASVHDARDSGQLSIFDLLGGSSGNEAHVTPIKLPDIPEIKGKEKLQWEKELLGVYSISHPLMQIDVDLKKATTCSCAELDERYDGKGVALAGVITNVRTINTKKGDPMAFVQLQDIQGSCEVVFFPKTYAECREKLTVDAVILVKGKAQTREGETSLLADTVQTHFDKIVLGEETPRLQTPLFAGAPTINGLALHGGEGDGDDDGDTWDEMPGGSAADGSEVSPFLAEMPSWMQDGAAPPPLAVEAAAAPAAVLQDDGGDGEAEGDASDEAPALPPVMAAVHNGAVHTPAVTPLPAPASDASAAAGSAGEARKKPAAIPAAEAATPPSGEAFAPTEASATPPAEPPVDAGPSRRPVRNSSNGPRCLVITFRRSGDLERDKFRLRQIYDLVRDPKGRDSFCIRIVNSGRTAELTFPNDGCTITDRLTSELKKHFRLEVVVE